MTTTFRRVGFAAALALATVSYFSTAGWTNGLGFFEDMEEHEDAGSPYFGFVKDTKGKFVPDATIVAAIKEMNSSVTARTDVQGHYRIPGFNKNIDPKLVEITCSKEGFKQVNIVRRPSANNGPIEINCTMAPQ